MKLTEAQSQAMRESLHAHNDYLNARKVRDAIGLNADVTIPQEYYHLAIRFSYSLYNPNDFGKDGKINEVEYRIKQTTAKTLKWSFFHARPAGKRDTKDGELKSGAGDFYRVKAGNYENALALALRSTKSFVWDTDYFTIKCTFGQLCSYLDGYKKGLTSWLPASKAAYMADGTILLRMQEWKTNPKIAYLQACPYNVG